jgi:hypothetical protein
MGRASHSQGWPEDKSGSTSRSWLSNHNGERKITMMIKGIRVRIKEGMGTTSKAVRLVRFPLFCLAGALFAGLAFYEAGSTNLSAAESYATSERGAISTERGDKPGKDVLPPVVRVSNSSQDREVYQLTPTPNPSIGVEIIGGLALFFWIQRFRNSSV